MTVIEEKLQQKRDEMNNILDEDFEKLSAASKRKEFTALNKALMRLDRFPRFYSSQGAVNFSSQSISIGRSGVVQVEFLDDNDWTSSGRLVGFD